MRFFPVNLREQYFIFQSKKCSFLAGAERGQLTGVLTGELAHEYCGGMLGAADLRPALGAGVLGAASAALIEGRAQGVQVNKNTTCGDLGYLCNSSRNPYITKHGQNFISPPPPPDTWRKRVSRGHPGSCEQVMPTKEFAACRIFAFLLLLLPLRHLGIRTLALPWRIGETYSLSVAKADFARVIAYEDGELGKGEKQHFPIL